MYLLAMIKFTPSSKTSEFQKVCFCHHKLDCFPPLKDFSFLFFVVVVVVVVVVAISWAAPTAYGGSQARG